MSPRRTKKLNTIRIRPFTQTMGLLLFSSLGYLAGLPLLPFWTFHRTKKDTESEYGGIVVFLNCVTGGPQKELMFSALSCLPFQGEVEKGMAE